ncbi:hypothetical protein C3L57_08055, partial [Veillonellaceae bacterium M2-8]|nr:hypothetical protein [Veillonellaceae bacterium M2-8]
MDFLVERLFEVADGVFDESEGCVALVAGRVVHVGEVGFDSGFSECEVGGDGIFAEAHCDE